LAQFTPGYLNLKKNNLLHQRVEQATAMLTSCTLCPRQCRVDRTSGQKGFCKTGEKAVIASYAPHFGEEPPLSGTNGSGTIFFAHCNLQCCFCQNYDIACIGDGLPASPGQLAAVMLELKKQGCHNINLVTPSHVVPQFLQAIEIASDQGLDIPIVYNTSGYDCTHTLKLLDGIVDIYLPDVKFLDVQIAKNACNAPDYPAVVKQALIEMHRQVNALKINAKGIAIQGLLVRHLVLPDNLAGTDSVMAFIHHKVSKRTCVNVMSQYRPMGVAWQVASLSRPVTPEEYKQARQIAQTYGLNLI
jgi:putative pyruvate formate lyase activating enzyme